MFMIWDSSHEDLQLSDWVSNIASYGFISLYVNPPSFSYDRAFFKNLTFKIQGQSHSSRPHNRNNILSTHIPLVPCQSALPFPRYSIFKIWPWKSKVKVIAQGHKVGLHPIDSHPFCSMLIDPAIPGIQQFQNLTLKIQGPGHGWGQSWKS